MSDTSAAPQRPVRRRLRKLARLANPSDRAVLRAVRWLTALAISFANLVGTVIVFVILVWVIPPRGGEEGDPALVNLIFAAAYVLVAVPLGIAWSMQRLRPGRQWLASQDRPPTKEEQRNILRAPLSVAFVVGALWLLAAVLFATLNATYSFELARRVGVTLVLAGLATGQIAYLLTEWLLRPMAARALKARPLEDPALPGVTARTIFTWGLASGVPMLGLAITGLSVVVDQDMSRSQLAIAVMVISGTGLLIGFLATLISARVTADPIISVRHAVSEVERGDLDVEVPVYDGSELGVLQSGFNQMVTGLRERERIRELFGRHVGEDVAREALERDESLGGETREAAVLFIDMVGSTELASTRAATEVVEILNEFFGIVVEAVDSHDGWVNKFEGDAALAIYGAPQQVDDPAGCALASAREIAERLARELDGVDAGIGVSFGEVVAGNIGGAKRFEYTVIGDAVNEAARLMDLAKDRDCGALASSAALERAEDGESTHWELGDEVRLRGRSKATRLASLKAG